MPLTYSDRGESKSGMIWDVMQGELPVAKIWKEMSSNERRQSGAWAFHVSCRPEGFQIHSSDENLEAAKEWVEQHWQAWLDAAKLSER